MVGAPAPLADGIVVDLGVWHATFTASQTNELIYQIGSASAQSRMEWVDDHGKHLSYVGDKGSFFGIRLSHDARRILVGSGDPATDLWLYDASSTNKTRITFDSAVVSEAAWSPDDSRFSVNIGLVKNRSNLIVKSFSRTGPTTLLREANEDNDSPTDWSPDGRYLLTERFLNGRSEIWLQPLDQQEAARPFLTSSATKGLQSSGQFSPDGKYVAFVLSVSSGPQVFIVSFPSGNGMWQVPDENARWPRWQRDGKRLFFVSSRNFLTAVDIRETQDSLEIGHPVPLFSFRPSRRTYRQGMIDFDVSPDGKRFLLNAAADQNTRPLTLVVIWTAELHKGGR